MTCSFRPDDPAPSAEFRAIHEIEATAPEPEPDLEALVADAYERGRLEALAELPVAEAARLTAAAAALDSASEAFGAEVATFRELARASLVEIALAVAERILDREVSFDPRALDSLVDRALRELVEPMQPVIRLSPEDHGTWIAGSAVGLDESARRIGAELAPDPELRPGQVVIHDGARTLDLRLPAVLAVVRGALLEAEPPTEEAR